MTGRKRIKALFFFLLAIATASAGLSCIDNATDVILSDPASGLGGLILAVLGFTAVLIAGAYMIGSVFSHAAYTVFAKDELYHLLFSVAILASFSGIVLLSCSIMDLFYVSVFENLGSTPSNCYIIPEASMQSVAECYVRLAKNDAEQLSRSYIKGYLNQLMDSTFSWSLQLPLLNSYTSTAGAYKRIISNQYDMILNAFIIPALMSISMQKLALTFIKENLVSWVLPSAFVLRVFIPTRQMGNMLIALVLALYILVPFMYVFNFAMYDSLMPEEECLDPANADLQEAVCDGAIDSGCNPASETCKNRDGFWNVARLLPQAFFLPNLTIALVITFMSAMHKALRVIG